MKYEAKYRDRNVADTILLRGTAETTHLAISSLNFHR